ncbi:transglutaminase [Bacillus sp. AFS076308]|uniref:transglutaminase-like domain-containing protein n=1 Tax=unclassified Bacillus (in: firmicutes) TaxID=185979 RepID=UPI000BF4E148|nr:MULTISPECIES: transglutaminase family protein [unclassified Bacillus (in: firmicutes)]PFO07423.1 transglutaminase [Bacillus sp. AFS076308]PGV52050.1 transglutaminase [Bacillus sp. AFS037270]
MELIVESADLKDYLKELDEVDFSHPLIQEVVAEIFNDEQTEIEKVKTAFEFVRDKISHSWDIQSTIVTCKASEVLKYKEGICYAKSNLLAALLRSQGIPTGFCYQRLMIFDTPDKGYSLHTLNGVFLSSLNRWIRLDARGNKPGVQAEFSLDEEILAFSIQEKFDEIDYPTIFFEPNPKTIATLQRNINALEMYKHHLPDILS